MKFSRSLQINSVPEWSDYYISYSNLKKIIYQLEKAVVAGGDETQLISDEEEGRRPLIAEKDLDANSTFSKALDNELEKIVSFFMKKEKELIDEVDALASDIAFVERRETAFSRLGSIDRGPESNEPQSPTHGTQTLTQRSPGRGHDAAEDSEISMLEAVYAPSETSPAVIHPHTVWSSKKVKQQKAKFKKRTTELFVYLCELKDYIDLNYTGFSKILKKYNKCLGMDLKSWYLTHVLETAYPFLPERRQHLETATTRVVSIYSRIATDEKMDLAWTALRSHLRERIVWDRNTIWRDMIEQERRIAAIKPRAATPAGAPGLPKPVLQVTILGKVFEFEKPGRSFWFGILSSVVFFILLVTPTLPSPEQRNCLAMLVFAVMLWAFEVIPLFVTSLLIPLLAVVLQVVRQRDPDDPSKYVRLSPTSASKFIFSSMFSHVIMLLLGGFSLAAALSKHHIAKGLAAIVLGKAGTKPQAILLVNMVVACVASMFISNVAAPVLCFSLVQPILRTLPHQSRYARCLIMGVALSSNIGGMASPIASPQNIIALQNMSPITWLQWFAVALPVCITSIIVLWLLLLMIYKPEPMPAAPPALRETHIRNGQNGSLSYTQMYILIVSGFTIILWCIGNAIQGVVGEMGVIAILPIVLFFGTGVLTKDDFNNFLWTVIVLAMGGITLGKAVDSSGLLETITDSMVPVIAQFSVWQQFAIFAAIVGVLTTFISHTVGAMIILPIVASVGNAVGGHPAGEGHGYGNLLVMGSALMCSAAMGLPISSFPNMNAISLEDSTGVPWLKTSDFLKVGILGTLVCYVCIVTLAYWCAVLAL